MKNLFLFFSLASSLSSVAIINNLSKDCSSFLSLTDAAYAQTIDKDGNIHATESWQEKTESEKVTVYYKVDISGKVIVVTADADYSYTKEETKPVVYGRIGCPTPGDDICHPSQWKRIED